MNIITEALRSISTFAKVDVDGKTEAELFDLCMYRYNREKILTLPTEAVAKILAACGQWRFSITTEITPFMTEDGETVLPDFPPAFAGDDDRIGRSEDIPPLAYEWYLRHIHMVDWRKQFTALRQYG